LNRRIKKMLEYVACKISKFHKRGRVEEIYLKFEDKAVTNLEEIKYLKSKSKKFASDMEITILDHDQVIDYFSIIFKVIMHLTPSKHLTPVKERNIKLKDETIKNIEETYKKFYNNLRSNDSD